MMVMMRLAMIDNLDDGDDGALRFLDDGDDGDDGALMMMIDLDDDDDDDDDDVAFFFVVSMNETHFSNTFWYNGDLFFNEFHPNPDFLYSSCEINIFS